MIIRDFRFIINSNIMETKPHMIIGLGNPDKEYKKTWHNVGFLVIDYLAGENFKKEKFFKFIKKENFIFIKSLNYMNSSGSTILAALKKFNKKPSEILVVHDDSDLMLGKYKISFDRGSAGHRGVESVIKSLNTKNFWRLRIGIRQETKTKAGPPAEVRPTRTKAGEFVLRKISIKDLKILSEEFDEIKDKIINV